MKNLPLLLATVLGTIVLIVAAAVFLSPTQNNANQSKEIDQVSLRMRQLQLSSLVICSAQLVGRLPH